MTRDEAITLAQLRNATESSGRWFARSAGRGWEIVHVAHALGTPQRARGTALQPTHGPGPDPHPSLPGGVQPWATGS